VPVVVGFGIRTPEQVRDLAGAADGIVVGSALVEALGRSPGDARSLVASLRSALDPTRV
jgi:tryptophan synthase alpha chain